MDIYRDILWHTNDMSRFIVSEFHWRFENFTAVSRTDRLSLYCACFKISWYWTCRLNRSWTISSSSLRFRRGIFPLIWYISRWPGLGLKSWEVDPNGVVALTILVFHLSMTSIGRTLNEQLHVSFWAAAWSIPPRSSSFSLGLLISHNGFGLRFCCMHWGEYNILGMVFAPESRINQVLDFNLGNFG